MLASELAALVQPVSSSFPNPNPGCNDLEEQIGGPERRAQDEMEVTGGRSKTNDSEGGNRGREGVEFQNQNKYPATM